MITRFLLPLLLLAAVVGTPGCKGMQSMDDTLVGFDTTNWTMLGERQVSLAGDRDVIPVTALRGRFLRIMIVVHDSALEMYDIRVTFANGDVFSPATRLHFAEDSRSRAIDLPGGRRAIRKVEFAYRSRNLATGLAEVELWGKR